MFTKEDTYNLMHCFKYDKYNKMFINDSVKKITLCVTFENNDIKPTELPKYFEYLPFRGVVTIKL